MTFIARNRSAVVAVSLLLVSCSQSTATPPAAVLSEEPAGARLSTAEVIRIATDAAEASGVNLLEYGEPEVRYGLPGEPDVWLATFKHQPARPVGGGFFSVSVDDQTGATKLLGGA